MLGNGQQAEGLQDSARDSSEYTKQPFREMNNIQGFVLGTLVGLTPD